jgi:hypothetical protein
VGLDRPPGEADRRREGQHHEKVEQQPPEDDHEQHRRRQRDAGQSRGKQPTGAFVPQRRPARDQRQAEAGEDGEPTREPLDRQGDSERRGARRKAQRADGGEPPDYASSQWAQSW